MFFCFHFRQGRFYTIELITKDGRVFPPSLIKKQLEKVVEMAGGKEERLEKEREGGRKQVIKTIQFFRQS